MMRPKASGSRRSPPDAHGSSPGPLRAGGSEYGSGSASSGPCCPAAMPEERGASDRRKHSRDSMYDKALK